MQCQTCEPSLRFSRSFTSWGKKKICFSSVLLQYRYYEGPSSFSLTPPFQPHSKTVMLNVLLQLDCYAFCLETSVEKEEEKNHWKHGVEMNLAAGEVKNHTYQGDFVQGEEMRAGHIY